MIRKTFLPLPLPVLSFFIFALVSAAAFAAEDLRLEDVVARCAAALGGEEAWGAAETLEIRGTHTSFSQKKPLRLLRRRPNLYRLEFNELKHPLVHAFDGEIAWWITENATVSRANWPVEAPDPHARAIRLDAEFDMPCLDAGAKGHRLEWVGASKFEGEPFLELSITREDGIVPSGGVRGGDTVDGGSVERWFLDPETYLPVLRVSEGTYHGYYTEQVQRFDEYREVAGLKLPHHVETEVGNDFLEVDVEEVRVNVEIDASMFRRPLPAGMERLRALVGDWRVEIENRDDPAVHSERRKPWVVDETSSVITNRHDGSLLAEEITVTTQRPRRITRLYSYDRFRERYRVAYFDTFSSHLEVLEGGFTEDGRLVLSNLETGTALMFYDVTYRVRETVYVVAGDGFRLEREISTDGGKTWMPDLRFAYARRSGE